MRVIVFGSEGYIGQNLVLELLSKHCQLTCYDVYPSIKNKAVEGAVEYRQMDVTDPENLRYINWDVEAVVYLSGLTGTSTSVEQAAQYIKVNEIGLVQVLDSMVKTSFRPHFIFPSTRLVYKGGPGPKPEDAPKEFKTVYAWNKFAGEMLLDIYRNKYGLYHTVLRICIPYGNLTAAPFSYGTIGFMLQQARSGSIKLYGDGSQRRTFTHVGDIISIMYQIALGRLAYGTVLNIGGEDFSLGEVAGMIAKQKDCSVELTPWPEYDKLLESGDTVFDDSRLIGLLSYRYKYHFSDWLSTI